MIGTKRDQRPNDFSPYIQTRICLNHNRTGRRAFLLSAGGLAAAPLLAGAAAQALAPTTTRSWSPAAAPIGRRRLGKLEVSIVGLGVQNMSRKYETTVPYRPEMINIIRTAYDRGVTFFDAAEAYGRPIPEA